MGKWERMFGKPLVKLQPRPRRPNSPNSARSCCGPSSWCRRGSRRNSKACGQEIERALSRVHRDQRHAPRDLRQPRSRAGAAARPAGAAATASSSTCASSAASTASPRSPATSAACRASTSPKAWSRRRRRSSARYLDPRQHMVIGFATRTQGLMVAKGNPKGIHDLSDLTRPQVRLINRQRDSGSRIEFDELLSGAGIDPAAIDGYQTEEFTHLAVAATVAGGMADAGYGIRAAAAHYGLDFIPLAHRALLPRLPQRCPAPAAAGEVHRTAARRAVARYPDRHARLRHIHHRKILRRRRCAAGKARGTGPDSFKLRRDA